MRTPPLFYGLICGAALTTLSLSTLPVGAQTRHREPIELDDLLMPNPVPDAPGGGEEEDSANTKAFIKQWHRIHGDKNGKIDPNLILAARAKAAKMKGGGGGGHGLAFNARGAADRLAGNAPSLPGPGLPSTGGNGGWLFVGPNAINPEGNLFGFGPDNTSGRVSAAAFDPHNPNTFYIASATGGIWKTQDAGAHWVPLLDNAPGNANDIFSCVTVDPNNSNVIWAGSGDYDYGNSPGFGLFKSTDAGATWTVIPQTALPSASHSMRKVLVDPHNSNHVLVALGRDWHFGLPGDPNGDFGVSAGSIYQTMDGGTTWTDVANFGCYVDNIVYNMDNSILYAAVDSSGVYSSLDNGMTWNGPLGGIAINTPIDSIDSRVDVVASPTAKNTVYVISENDEAVYMSPDAGVTWNDVTNNLTDSYGFGGTQSAAWGQSNYDFYIAAAPATFTVGGPGVENGPGTVTTDVLYVGLLGITHSINAGGYWSDLTLTYTGNDILHTDQHCLAVNPNNPNQILVGSDGGIYLCNYTPDTDSFAVEGLNNNLGITDLYWSAVNPTDPLDILAASQDNSTSHTVDEPTVWGIFTTGDGMCVAYTNTAPLVEYQGIDGGFFIQSDDGFGNDPYNFSAFAIPPPDAISFFTPMAMTANSAFFITAGLQFDIYNHGPTVYPAVAGAWTTGASLIGPNNPGDQATEVGASPSNESILFAGMLSGAIFYSLDKGNTAVEFDGFGTSSSSWLPQLPVTSITASYKKVNRVYVTLGVQTSNNISHVWRCDNITAKPPVWIPIDGRDQNGNPGPNSLPEVVANSIVVAPHDDEQTLYVATDAGVFVSYDGGTNWESFNTVPGTTTPLPNVIVNRLTFNPGTGTLDASTWGRGLWRAVVGNDVPLLIRTSMPAYRGNKSKLGARIDLFQAGLIDVAPNFEEPTAIGYPYRVGANGVVGTPNPYKYLLQPTEIRLGSLSAAGYYNANISSQGFYDVMLTVPRFLRKRIRNVNTSTSPLSPVTLTLGDCAGPIDAVTGNFGPPDNVINVLDELAIETYIEYEELGLVSKYNSSTLDLNGDGIVDVKDLNIVRAALLANGGLAIRGD
jgi:hypothetical protein